MSVEFKNINKHINITNTSAAFRGIMNKYRKKLKLSRDFNKDIILKQIYSKIQQIENNERENDYIISEVRRNAQINQEILYSFGTKALNHINEVIKVNVSSKMDKNKFLGINDYKNKSIKKIKLKKEKNYFYNNHNKNNNNKFIILPRIVKTYHSKELNNSKSSSKNKNIKNNYIIDNNNSKISKNRRKNLLQKYSYSSFKKDKSIDINPSTNSNYINNLTPIKKRKENSNDSIVFFNEPLFTERSRFKSNLIDTEYINYIRTMGNQFSETEKKQEKYFSNNKYGVDAFKLKYNYLRKKYFN